MTRKEREEDPGSSFDGGYHLFAKEQHKARVAKTPDRVAYAIKQLEEHNIEIVLKNPAIGHFHCRSKKDDRLVQFWAGTGKIYDAKAPKLDKRGIHALIRYLEV